MKGKTYTTQFRRKREGKTDYKKRLKLLLSDMPRLVIRKSLNNTLIQIVKYHPNGDKVILSSHSGELGKFGWKFGQGNIPAAYLTGFLLGTRAKNKKIEKAVLDIGLNSSTKGNRIYAALKGVVDAKLEVPHSDSVLPSKERTEGKHIADFAKKIKKTELEQISKAFEAVKKNIADKNETQKS